MLGVGGDQSAQAGRQSSDTQSQGEALDPASCVAAAQSDRTETLSRERLRAQEPDGRQLARRCALAVSGHAAAALPTSVMNSRRPMLNTGFSRLPHHQLTMTRWQVPVADLNCSEFCRLPAKGRAVTYARPRVSGESEMTPIWGIGK